MAKLTKTQIKAVCDKLKREFEAKLDSIPDGMTEDEMYEKNVATVTKIIRDSNLPSSIRTNLTRKYDCTAESIVDDMKPAALKALGCPYPTAFDRDSNRNNAKTTKRNKFTVLLADLEFELTMAGTEDYKGYMDAFNKKVAKIK